MASIVEVPGKLVLMGEYAVLDGAPALSLAVSQGVRCQVRPGAMQITTPTGDDRFVRAALEHLGMPPANYYFSDSSPVDTTDKPGTGGSAASVIAALLAGGFQGTPAELTRIGIAIHRAVQGSGSGIDVATSAWGGGIRFENEEVSATSLPTPLVVYAEASAKTGPRVQRYREWAGRQGFVDASRQLVDAFLSDPIAITREAWRQLTAMAQAADVPYRTPVIDAVVALAEAHGGAAKPSGAGGGDAIVVFSQDPAAMESILLNAGHHLLPIQAAGAPTVTERDLP